MDTCHHKLYPSGAQRFETAGRSDATDLAESHNNMVFLNKIMLLQAPRAN